jgi:hypothetical protein
MKIIENKLSDWERERLISKIASMKNFDEIRCNRSGGPDFNVIIKIDSGYLFKGMFTENYVYTPYL